MKMIIMMRILRTSFSFLLVFSILLASNTRAALASTCTHFVSPSGSDGNSGTSVNQPWKTIQKAADTVGAGSTVCVRGGIYHEKVQVNVSGSDIGGWIEFQSYAGETAILDGEGLTVQSGWSPLIKITDQSYIRIIGFEIRNHISSAKNHVPIGIYVSGEGGHIDIIGNFVHNIETNYGGTNGGDAHGIAVYGTGNSPLTGILIEGNELSDLKLGSSEALVVNGNVDGFSILNNVVHDTNNIGIDAIGFEGNSPNPAQDQARNGLIADNDIYNIDSHGNPAYGNERSADCIYVDGGTQIVIERNRAHQCNLGLELASEHAGKATSFITARNNLIYNNSQAGIAIGGYDTHRGSTEDSLIVNNTLYNNATQGDWGAELYVQYDIRNNTISNNLIYSNKARRFIESWSSVMSGNTIDHNLYYAAGGGESGKWIWQDTAYKTFTEFQSATGNDPNGLAGSAPQLIQPDAGLFVPVAPSPAIDAGDNLTCAPDDFENQTRPSGAACDIGSYEYVNGGSTSFVKIQSTGGQDGWILESSENSSKGGSFDSNATSFHLGDDAADRQYRSILSFDTSSLNLPAGSIINSVTLAFKKAALKGTNPFLTHGNIQLDFKTGVFSGNQNLQIGDFQAAASMDAASNIGNTSTNKWYSVSIDSALFSLVNRDGFTQIRLGFSLDDNDDLGMDRISFFSGDAGSSKRPQLIVEYYIP